MASLLLAEQGRNRGESPGGGVFPTVELAPAK
jgi:hypothetical protein